MNAARSFVSLSSTRRSSAVSAAWRAISGDLEASGEVAWDCKDGDEVVHRLYIASERSLRERAYRLAHKVYSSAGYACGDDRNLCLSPYDLDPNTLTLLAVDGEGRDVATVSLVCDSEQGLPCDSIYRNELTPFRAEGRRLVEVTRLAMDGKCPGAKFLLLRLFSFIYIFARRVSDYGDFIIEVNPRHVGYYSRLLDFEQIGEERPCPRVQGAPAVLLRLDLHKAEQQIEAQRLVQSAPQSRPFYAFVHDAEDEAAIAGFLKRQHKPMSKEDALYFRLIPTEAVV